MESIYGSAGEKFLMPAKTTTGIRMALAEYRHGRWEKAPVYAMAANGGTQFAFRPALEKRMRLIGGRRTQRHLAFPPTSRRT